MTNTMANFKELIASTVSDSNPVLVMYFTKNNNEPNKLFAIPIGISSNNTISVSNRPDNLNTNDLVWFAKFYVYINPTNQDDYIFKINGTGDARLYLNNTLIIDAWSIDGSEGKNTLNNNSLTAINLNPNNGPYLLYVEYRYKNFPIGTVNIPTFNITYNPKSSTAQKILKIPPTTVDTSSSSIYITKFSPYVLTENARKDQSIKYCKTTDRFATDDFCVGKVSTTDPSKSYIDGVNFIYGSGVNDNDFQKTMTEYCTTDNRFATDNTFCADTSKKLQYIYNPTNGSTNSGLETSLYNYCNNTNNTYCKITDNYNTNNNNLATANMHANYAKKIRDGRLTNIQRAISDSLASTTAQGVVSQDVLDYITTDYPNIQSKFSSTEYPVSNIVTPTLSQYCEFNQDSNSALCNTIYGADANNIYKNNLNITASKERKDNFKLAIDSNAFMGVSTDPALNTKYKIERDAPDTFSRYLPFAINYCSSSNNIKNNECQEYYNNIQDKIQSGINKQYNAPSASTFTNKEPYCNGKNEYNNDECSNSNVFILFLLFLFVIVMAISFGGISNCRNFNYNRQYNNIKSTY